MWYIKNYQQNLIITVQNVKLLNTTYTMYNIESKINYTIVKSETLHNHY